VSNIPIKNEASGSTAATAVAVVKNPHPPVGRKFEQQVNMRYKARIEAFFPKKKKEGRWELQVPIHFCMSIMKMAVLTLAKLPNERMRKVAWQFCNVFYEIDSL
jgi:hypothetical protein